MCHWFANACNVSYMPSPSPSSQVFLSGQLFANGSFGGTTVYPALASSNMRWTVFALTFISIQMCTGSRFREILKCRRFQACFFHLFVSQHQHHHHLTDSSLAIHAKEQKEMARRLPGSRTHHLHLQKGRRILNHQADGRMSPWQRWSLGQVGGGTINPWDGAPKKSPFSDNSNVNLDVSNGV